MKSVLISIRPKWCEKIASGEKTIEVRKTAPKEVPFKAYIYCTKAKSQWRYSDYEGAYENSEGKIVYAQQRIIGEFICDKVTKFTYDGYGSYSLPLFLRKAICLDGMELYDYLRGKDGYGLHISDLKIYDKPKELSEFRKLLDRVYCSYCKDYCEQGCISFGSTDYSCNDYWNWEKGLTRPPQSWQYVEEI